MREYIVAKKTSEIVFTSLPYIHPKVSAGSLHLILLCIYRALMQILRGFGRGLGTTLCRELPAFACYFGSYDALLKITNYHPTDDHATVKVQNFNLVMSFEFDNIAHKRPLGRLRQAYSISPFQ